MPLKIKIMDGEVSPEMIQHVSAICSSIERVVDIPDAVGVYLCKSKIPDKMGRDCCGMFSHLPDKSRPPQIHLKEEFDKVVGDSLDYVSLSLAHEIAHYERYRDDKEITERGVEMRGRNILRQAKIQPKEPGFTHEDWKNWRYD